MSNPAKSTPGVDDIEARFAALRAEFPGFEIGPCDLPSLPYRAFRERDGEKALVLVAGTYDGLWGLLSQQDAADCERALLELGKALTDRGAVVIEQGASLVTRTRTGIARSIGALRGNFLSDSGLPLGPIAEVDEVALRVARLLGLELHPQLSVLARRMGVRRYSVDIGAPVVTVATPAGVSPPRAVRVTCEPRPTDEGREWFWTHWGDPIAEAADITGAEVKLVGLLASEAAESAES